MGWRENQWKGLIDDAEQSYRDRRYTDAGATYDVALELYRNEPLNDELITEALYAAVSWGRADRPERFLTILSQLLESDLTYISNKQIRWLKRTEFEAALYFFPRRRTLVDRLAKLNEFGRSQGGRFDSDFHVLNGDYHHQCGDHLRALSAYEKAWARFPDADGGFSEGRISYGAAWAALALGRMDESDRWVEVLSRLPDDDDVRVRRRLLNVRVALRQNNVLAADQSGELLAEEVAGSDWQVLSRDAAGLIVRASLLNADHGDPDAPAHRARIQLMRRRPTPQRLDLRVRWRLTVLQYRIACVRWAAGLAPVDDLSAPQVGESPIAPSSANEVNRRLGAARTSARAASAAAAALDERLEVTYWGDWATYLVERLERVAGVRPDPAFGSRRLGRRQRWRR